MANSTLLIQQESQRFQQETRANIQNLENQMSQLMATVSRLEKSSKEVEDNSSKAEEDTTNEQIEKSSIANESTEEVSKESNTFQTKILILPHVPSRLAQPKKEEENEILETSPKEGFNTSLLEAIKQVSIPFMKTVKTKIDVDLDILTLEFNGKIITFNIFDIMKYPNDFKFIFHDSTMNFVFKENVTEDVAQ